MSANAGAVTTIAPPPRRSTRNGRAIPRPFLKWVGGKGQLLAELRKRVPDQFNRYIEPFVGGGAMFFHLRPPQAVLADLNGELIDAFTAVRDDLEATMEFLREHVYEKTWYYRTRSRDPEEMELAERAARTIYLNRTGFNGLYRVNSKGRFNVPFGRYKDPLICDQENLTACRQALQGADLVSAPFDEVLDGAQSGDFVYMDPPYVPLSKTANFTQYVAGGFGPEAQERLASWLERLHGRGVRFALSNADTPETRAMYGALAIDGLRIDGVTATRSVNSRTTGRGRVGELIVWNPSVD